MFHSGSDLKHSDQMLDQVSVVGDAAEKPRHSLEGERSRVKDQTIIPIEEPSYLAMNDVVGGG